MKKIRIGSGAGYAGDRLEPALELLEKGNLDYIAFECLAERTVAVAQAAKLKDPTKGYNDLLSYRMERVIPLAHEKRVKVISNMGAANPQSAIQVCADIARKHGITGLKIAAVIGDDVLDQLADYQNANIIEMGIPLGELGKEVVSANVYLGLEGLVQALAGGADIVITGRVADPALFLAPLVHEFGWDTSDWSLMGKGTALGHLLECAGQVTGGYFADPGKKDVPNLDKLGFPIAEVSADGSFFITKVDGSGGIVTPATCTEQLLYEVHDPANYLTPDVTADFSDISFEQTAKDVVQVHGATGTAKPQTLKVSVGYKDSFVGDGEISYGGHTCVERAKLAADIVVKRLQHRGIDIQELKVDLIGINSLYWGAAATDTANNPAPPTEVRLRVSARTADRASAAKIGEEVETLYTNGPAGGGGVTKTVREMVAVCSILLDRDSVTPSVIMLEV